MKRTLLFLSLLLLNATYLFAGTTGKIAGTTVDAATGDPLPFVNVIIMGTTLGAASDIDGEFSILNVPPGVYEVKASAIGFNPVVIQNVRVSIDLTTNLEFNLTETSLELGEDVVVVATRPLVRKDLTSSAAIVGDDLIRELPVVEINDVIQLQAGVVVGSDGGLHLRGGRSGQVTYQIDGVPVTDAYDGSTVVDVNANAVQELQVVSGAFNAEYGQALSGVINLVTKDGNNEYKGNLMAYIGDYISSRDNIFWNVSDVNPGRIQNYEGSLSGPVLKDQLFFFANFRYHTNDGFHFGRRDYLVTDVATEVEGSGGAEFDITQSGDGSYVPLSPSEKIFGQGKLTYRFLQGIKVSYNFILEREDMKFYDGNARITPDNNLNRFRRGYTHILNWNHAISPESFYTANLSYFQKSYEHYLFENIYTGNPQRPTQYVDNTIHQTPPYSYPIGGTNYNRFNRDTKTFVAKLDWATQLTQEINFQFGGEFRQNEIFYENINLVPMYDDEGQKVSPFNVEVPPVSSVDHDIYTRKPLEGAAYAQAKFEAFNMIFNVGLRWDIFNSDGIILHDPEDPDYRRPLKPDNQFNDLNGNGVYEPELGETIKTNEDRLQYWYEDAEVKTQVSPRLGIAFPITDKGVIHFSYGHFFQLPRYELLYTNPDFKMGTNSGNAALMGNSDLRPQKTVKGEIGLQQQLGDNTAIDVTMFFEDFRDLTGTQTEEIVTFGGAQSYTQYANSDFGFARGIIFKFTQRFAGGFAANIDYTFSDTKGNASNPQDARNAVLGGALPETFIVPLNWDQTHTLNFSIAYTKPGDFGFSLIGNFFTGQPYTPAVNKFTRVTQNAFPRNSDSKPTIFNLDLRVYKDFQIAGGMFSVFLRGFNLLDWDNPVNVYSDTGDPFFTIAKYEAQLIDPTLYTVTLDELFTNPTFFSSPRRIELGLQYNF